MPQLTLEELCIANLRGDFPDTAVGYMTKEVAHAELVRVSGLDFGLDARKWSEWLKTRHKNVPGHTVADPREAIRLARLHRPGGPRRQSGE